MTRALYILLLSSACTEIDDEGGPIPPEDRPPLQEEADTDTDSDTDTDTDSDTDTDTDTDSDTDTDTDTDTDPVWDAYVEAHNGVRALLSGGGVSGQPVPRPALPDLEYDPILAELATSYGEVCRWDHNDDRSAQYRALGGEDVYVGENLYAYSSTSTPDPEAVVGGWFSEHEFYDYDSLECDRGEMCGHYTQVVWRETSRVGCGVVTCPELEGLEEWGDAVIVVCNYAEGGNYGGQQPY
jgi:pathogenesis-related protein 1